MSNPKVEDATDALLIIRHIAIDCDSELSAQASGRPPSDKETLAGLSQSCRNVYEGAFPLVDRIKAALAAAQPAGPSESPGEDGDELLRVIRKAVSDAVAIDEAVDFERECAGQKPLCAHERRINIMGKVSFELRELAAQPKAPSPSEPTDGSIATLRGPGRVPGSCASEGVHSGDAASVVAAPSPTPGEVEEAFAFLAGQAEEAEICGALNVADAISQHLAALRAALPAQGWSREAPTTNGRCWAWHEGMEDDEVELADVADDGRHIWISHLCHKREDFIAEGAWWWMPASVPTPPNAGRPLAKGPSND